MTAPVFGNQKYGLKVDETKPEGKELAKVFQLFDKDAGERKAAKVQKVLAPKANPDLFTAPKAVKESPEAKDRSMAVMVRYPQALSLEDVRTRLLKFSRFSDSYLLKDTPEGVVEIHRKAGKDTLVGTLALGRAAYQEQGRAEGGRALLEKHHKVGKRPAEGAYVEDDAGVPTRRMAYLETSRQQLMESLKVKQEGGPEPAMRGRYARHRTAMGFDPDNTLISAADRELGMLYGTRTEGEEAKMVKADRDVMANIHQYLGSGINQRGISLTSTKKPVIFSNDGDSFRSDDGVRLTVDLALVPSTVVLLNHYADGGVGTRLRDTPKEGGSGGEKAFPQRLLKKPNDLPKGQAGYNYGASVVKNRELYLAELRPAWIVKVEDHLKTQLSPTAKKSEPPPTTEPETAPSTSPSTTEAKASATDAKPSATDAKASTTDAKASTTAVKPSVTDAKALVPEPEAPVSGGKPLVDAKLPGADLSAMRAALGTEHYEAGVAAGRTGAAVVKYSTEPFDQRNYEMGHAVGSAELRGRVAAKTDRDDFWKGYARGCPPVTGDVTAQEIGAVAAYYAGEDKQSILSTKLIWYVLVSLRSLSARGGRGKFRPKEYDAFWLGWSLEAGIQHRADEKKKADDAKRAEAQRTTTTTRGGPPSRSGPRK